MLYITNCDRKFSNELISCVYDLLLFTLSFIVRALVLQRTLMHQVLMNWLKPSILEQRPKYYWSNVAFGTFKKHFQKPIATFYHFSPLSTIFRHFLPFFATFYHFSPLSNIFRHFLTFFATFYRCCKLLNTGCQPQKVVIHQMCSFFQSSFQLVWLSKRVSSHSCGLFAWLVSFSAHIHPGISFRLWSLRSTKQKDWETLEREWDTNERKRKLIERQKWMRSNLKEK